MSEKMRSDFEAFAVTSAWLGADEEDMQRDGDGYLGFEVHSAWLGWQASRAALCVELPGFISITSEYSDAVNDCRDAIHAAGVKTK